MTTMTFRFTTEVEMTLSGDSYEDIYLSLKDFMHGKQAAKNPSEISVYPPESDQIFFQLDNDSKSHEIPYFKGDFNEDIGCNCDNQALKTAV